MRIPVNNLFLTSGKNRLCRTLRNLSSTTFERNLSGQFSPLTAPFLFRDALSFYRTPAHRSAPAHSIFGLLHSVFRFDPAALTCSAYVLLRLIRILGMVCTGLKLYEYVNE